MSKERDYQLDYHIMYEGVECERNSLVVSDKDMAKAMKQARKLLEEIYPVNQGYKIILDKVKPYD